PSYNFYASSCFAIPGDSGGPVIIKLVDGRYIQVGIINTGSLLNDDDESFDEVQRALIVALLSLQRIPLDFRSAFIGSEQFYSTVNQLKARYNDYHPSSNRVAQSQPSVQRQQPRTTAASYAQQGRVPHAEIQPQ